jgi:hypothetical protein
MGGENIILRRQGRADRDAGALLPDINVKMAANEPFIVVIEPNDMLFGAPDHQHFAQDAKLIVSCQIG